MRIHVIPIVILLAATPFLELPLSGAQGATLDVCPSGCAFGRIQDALDAASDGDVVNVAAGTYTETLRIGAAVTLRGAQAGVPAPGRNGSETTLDAGGLGGPAITIERTGATIDGLRVAANATLPIAVHDLAGSVVLNTRFAGYRTAILLDAPTARAEGNAFAGGTGASQALYATRSTVGLAIVGNLAGAHADSPFFLKSGTHDAIEVRDNEIAGGEGIVLAGARDATILRNVVTDATYFGIALVDAAGDIIIADNEATGYGFTGVSVRGSALDSLIVSSNVVTGDGLGYGLDLDVGGAAITLVDNDLADNHVHVATRGRALDVASTLAANALDFHAVVEGAGTDEIAGSLRAVVARAPSGATLRLGPGTLAGSVTITKPLTILGANAGVAPTGARGPETILLPEGGAALVVTGDDVTIDGLSFGAAGSPAIDASGAHRLVVRNAIGASQLRVAASDNATIERVRWNATSGVIADGVRGLDVRDVSLTGGGLALAGGRDARIERVDVQGAAVGISVSAANGLSVRNSSFRSNGDAIRLLEGARPSVDVSVRDSSFEASAGSAIAVAGLLALDGILDAEENWWSSPTGPIFLPVAPPPAASLPIPERVSGLAQIDFVPWCADDACAALGPPVLAEVDP